MNRDRIFISGSSGFLGRALGMRLQKDFEVVGASLRSSNLAWQNWQHDWRNPWNRYLKAPYFIHAAFDSRSTQGDEVAFHSNQLIAENASRAARSMRAKHVLLISTGSVYQKTPHFIDEGSLLETNPKSYGLSSLEVEGIFRKNLNEIPLTIVRLFYPYGEFQSSERLIPKIALRIRSGQDVIVDGDEMHPRINPVYVGDAVEAMARLVTKYDPGVSIFNLGGSDIVSIAELARSAAKVLGRECRISFKSTDTCSDLYCSIERLHERISFSPMTSLDAGLQAALKDLI